MSEITDEMIDDILCAAFEGGSNYWCIRVLILGRWPQGAEVHDYVECTYSELRSGPDGDAIAAYDGAWELPDGRRFSDWAVKV